MPSVPIQFYLPLRENNARERLPKSITDYWSWQCRTVPKNHFLGQYHWVLQTYLFLRESGLDCEYVTAFPAAGIVVTHREHLKETSYKPNRRLTIVCLQVDRPTFPFAQFHVVHSKMQEDKRRRSYYIPPWPQVSLIARDPSRGTRVENISYVGDLANLAPEFADRYWEQELNSCGFNWVVRDRDRWNDFSDLDVIVAARKLHARNAFMYKPALKLFNAWHAGVPAVLGSEVSYQMERKDPLDFIEVTSLPETLSALEGLRSDSNLYSSMVRHGLKRSTETSPARLAKIWNDFFLSEVFPFYFRQGRGFVFLMHCQKTAWLIESKKRALRDRSRKTLRRILGRA